MLLDFRGEIRSCGRLEVGRSSESSEPHEIPQHNIMLNWDFAEALFTATELDPKKTPNCSAHLLPTCINFEFETHFSQLCDLRSAFAQVLLFGTEILLFGKKYWLLHAICGKIACVFVFRPSYACNALFKTNKSDREKRFLCGVPAIRRAMRI